MQFDDYINRKADDLARKADEMKTIKIEWEDPVSIICEKLTYIGDLQETLDKLVIKKKYPALYYFIIKSSHSGTDIINSLKNFKDLNIRSCPRIDTKRVIGTKYLYCGSIKNGLHGRFVQHVGFGSPNTYALQLIHWAKDLGLVVEFNYGWMDMKYKEYTELMESALAEKLKPLVGKVA